MSNLKFTKLNKTIIFIYLILSLISIIYYCYCKIGYYIFLSVVSPFFLFIPNMIYKLFKFKPIPPLSVFINLFCFLSYMIGMVYKGYILIPYYDKIVHGISGAFFALLGIVYYYVLKTSKTIEKKDCPFLIYFAFSFSASSASVWEVYEFIISILLKTDPQGVLTTGVHDTMWDIILCILASIIVCIYIFLYFRKNFSSIFSSIIETFIASYNK